MRATIPGTASHAGSTHVTFTQETWTAIHAELDSKYPQQGIVGWYHTHPGLGVVFSEMDVFIQKHFFAGPTQVALVTDPLGGRRGAVCERAGRDSVLRPILGGGARTAHHDAGTGRRRRRRRASGVGPYGRARTARHQDQAGAGAIEEQRRRPVRFVVGTVMLVAVTVIGYIGYKVYQHMTGVQEPPRLESYIPVPIRVGDETVLLGVGVVNWNVPPRVDAAFVELERRRRQEAADSAHASKREGSER